MKNKIQLKATALNLLANIFRRTLLQAKFKLQLSRLLKCNCISSWKITPNSYMKANIRLNLRHSSIKKKEKGKKSCFSSDLS